MAISTRQRADLADGGWSSQAITVERLRAVPRVVAVAAGAHKASAILGALATGLPSMHVTDSGAARAILERGRRATGPASRRRRPTRPKATDKQ